MPSSRQLETIRFSVSNRVIVGLIAIILLFTGLTIYSVALYRNSVAEMDLINTTYVPLALGTSEIQSAQVIFNTLTDRLTEEPYNPMTRDWLNAARKYRPATLSRLIALITDTIQQRPEMPAAACSAGSSTSPACCPASISIE